MTKCKLCEQENEYLTDDFCSDCIHDADMFHEFFDTCHKHVPTGQLLEAAGDYLCDECYEYYAASDWFYDFESDDKAT